MIFSQWPTLPICLYIFAIPCLFGLGTLLRFWFLVFCFLSGSFYLLDFPWSFLVGIMLFFNSIVISALVFFHIFITLLNSVLKSWIIFATFNQPYLYLFVYLFIYLLDTAWANRSFFLSFLSFNFIELLLYIFWNSLNSLMKSMIVLLNSISSFAAFGQKHLVL